MTWSMMTPSMVPKTPYPEARGNPSTESIEMLYSWVRTNVRADEWLVVYSLSAGVAVFIEAMSLPQCRSRRLVFNGGEWRLDSG